MQKSGLKPFGLIIDGKKVVTEKTFGVRNPATGEIFAQCPVAELAHLDQAVGAAQNAFIRWRLVSAAERRAKVLALADILEQHMPELMELLTRENGKPLGGYRGIGSGMELGGAIVWTRVTAGLELPVEIIQDNDQARIEVHRKPLGVVGSIPPWNWPLMIAIWHVMPALLSGNTVVLKPSSLTPLTSLRFVELANEVLPPGVLNILTAESGIGSAMAKHPGINKIVFTGSTLTGKSIMRNGAENLKHCTLELGGNDAGIVLPDVDPKEIAPKLFMAGFHNNGQTCACLKRLYLHEAVYEDICREMTAIAGQLRVGNGLEEGVDFGPLQNEAQLNLVDELAEDAKKAGGRILCGGKRPAGPGYFYPLTLVADVKDGMRLVDEEQFGPILPIIKYTDIDEVIRRANRSPFGLGGSIWSKNVEQARQLAIRLECGTAWINDHASIQPDAPFGGVKESGYGVEFGRYGLEEYTSIQTLKIVKG
jgi:acyl-CoA reductase-like NAD-dependent aldehyde dehydrogenase